MLQELLAKQPSDLVVRMHLANHLFVGE
jgi:thioredoxin-like negative regulator of GroEL